MKRLESNLLNMLLSLTIVALVAAALLGGLYVLTEEPIAVQKQQKQQRAITAVLPDTEDLRIADAEELADGTVIYRAYDQNDNYIGAAVQTAENGFGGKFSLMIGFDAEGNVVGYEVLEHQETPGLGDHMTDWFKTDKNRQSVIGKSPATTQFVVSKDGGDIDAITAATISSRAFLKAAVKAYGALEPAKTDAESGASKLKPQLADSVQIVEAVETQEAAQAEVKKTEVVKEDKEEKGAAVAPVANKKKAKKTKPKAIPEPQDTAAETTDPAQQTSAVATETAAPQPTVETVVEEKIEKVKEDISIQENTESHE